MNLKVPLSTLAIALGFTAIGAPPAEVPAGKGSLDGAGKFVPPPPVAGATLPPVDRKAGEAKLREALKVEDLTPGTFKIGLVTFTKADRTVRIPAKINMRDGVVEYLLTTETGNTHEAPLTTKAAPQDFHVACLLIGVAAASPVEITATWETNGPPA